MGGMGAIWGHASERVHDLEGVCLPAVMAVARQRCHLSALAELVVWGDSLYLNRIYCITADDGRTIAKQVNLCHLPLPKKGSIYPAANGAHSSLCVALVHLERHMHRNKTNKHRVMAAPPEGLF